MRVKLSESHAIFGQGLILFFFVPFNLLLWYLVVRSNFNTGTMIFTFCVDAISALIIFLAFRTANVSIENGVFEVSNLFTKTRISVDQYKKAGPFLSFGYYLEFEGRKTVYVLYAPEEIIREVTASKTNTLMKIKSIINQELSPLKTDVKP